MKSARIIDPIPIVFAFWSHDEAAGAPVARASAAEIHYADNGINVTSSETRKRRLGGGIEFVNARPSMFPGAMGTSADATGLRDIA